jgi:hypothetical protein
MAGDPAGCAPGSRGSGNGALADFLGFCKAGIVGQGFRPAAVLLRGGERAGSKAGCSPEGLPHKNSGNALDFSTLCANPRVHLALQNVEWNSARLQYNVVKLAQ